MQKKSCNSFSYLLSFVSEETFLETILAKHQTNLRSILISQMFINITLTGGGKQETSLKKKSINNHGIPRFQTTIRNYVKQMIKYRRPNIFSNFL